MIQQNPARKATLWAFSALGLLLVGCAKPYLAVDVAVQFEDGRTRFAAFTERDEGPFHGGVEGVEVRFLVDGAEVARAQSDERGVATVLSQVPTGSGQFEATASFGGESFRRAAKIVQWSSHDVVVVCDIDATISDTALKALFFDETDEKSMPIADSPEVLNEIARYHGILYFTARPKFTVDKTERWLQAHGFPDGPVMTSLDVGDLILQGRYKRRELARLREVFPNLLIGIGNSQADSAGYGANGMLSLIVNRNDGTHYARHEIDFENWRQVGTFFEVNRDLLGDPEQLRAATRGEGMVVVPTLRFEEPLTEP